MSVIAIPLGFQFLAVLGGKALMLAKLALILTSIQGLKKIATSNFSYGLYHSPGRCKLILNSYSTTPIKSLITNSVHKRCYYCQENVNKLIMSYCQVCQLNLAPFTFFKIIMIEDGNHHNLRPNNQDCLMLSTCHPNHRPWTPSDQGSVFLNAKQQCNNK